MHSLIMNEDFCNKEIFLTELEKEELIVSIGNDLFDRFIRFQSNTKTKLTLGSVNIQCIYESLFDVSFSLQYEQSRRRFRGNLNFKYCSEIFKNAFPKLMILFENNSSEFRKFIDSIYDELLSKINCITKDDLNPIKYPPNKYNKTDFKKRIIEKRDYYNQTLYYVEIINLKNQKVFRDWVTPQQYNSITKMNNLIDWDCELDSDQRQAEKKQRDLSSFF